jgi:tetratricopeptide (TPR) repeat protein
VQTGYYLPRMLTERKDYDNAILMISVAAEVFPDNAETWVRLASAYALKGKAGRKRALESLDKAVALGWDDRAWIERDNAFEGLRQDERFREILARIPASGGGNG